MPHVLMSLHLAAAATQLLKKKHWRILWSKYTMFQRQRAACERLPTEAHAAWCTARPALQCLLGVRLPPALSLRCVGQGMKGTLEGGGTLQTHFIFLLLHANSLWKDE